MMVVDTCVIVDISDCDPVFGERSARVLEEYADGGLLIAPVTFVELAPAFLGDVNREKRFLFELGVDLPSGFDTSDITLAHALLNGWQPKVPLQEGLAKTIAYFRGRK